MWPKQETLYQSLPQLETHRHGKSPTLQSTYLRLWSGLYKNFTVILLCTNIITVLSLIVSIWGFHGHEANPQACLRQFSTPCTP
jgi:hypothetical protein